MRNSFLPRWVVACIAAIVPSACEGTAQAPVVPSVGSQPSGARLFATLWHGPQDSNHVPNSQGNDSSPTTSWMASRAKAQDLLYVANSTTVTVYSYPNGRLEGTLAHFYSPQGSCVDDVGDVFVTNYGTAQIFEYAHGDTKRIAALKTPTLEPIGCSIDPTTGDLAVSTLEGTVGIYKNARGRPTKYADTAITKFYWCTYDTKGNLFVDGQDAGSVFRLVELPKGSSSFVNITLNQTIGWPSGVQWDGKYIAIGDQDTPVIYQFRISGWRGIEVASTPLGSHAEYVHQFWVEAPTLVAPNVYFTGEGTKERSHYDVLFFKYPKGGMATKVVTEGTKFPTAAVVSLAKS